jgi:DedD protein
MAFFSSRQSGDAPAARQAESVETLRQRAKHRLIGSVVLVLAGVVGFPLLFDSQPRPLPVDIQIDMPDKAKVAPLQIPGPAVVQAPAPVPSAKPPLPAPTPETRVSPAASLDAKEQLIGTDTGKQPESKAEPKAEPKPEPKPEPKAVDAPKSPAKAALPDDGSRAKALLEGKDLDTSPRFIVQVGAYADADKARDARQKLERAGLKTYTHVAETPEGKRTRVRVGPLTSRAEADKVAAKVKALQLPAAVLTL